jgi:hypothetical protein
MDLEELNNNEKNTEYYLNKVIANQKRTINLLRLNAVLFLSLIVIKLFVTG